MPVDIVDDDGRDPPESLSFYKRKADKTVSVQLVNPVPGPSESLGKSDLFSLTPAIVHFGGLVVGELHEQVVSVVNVSQTSQRLSIYPATSGDFFADYEKRGSLAPGMSQKIVIRFRPKEYRYYHDYIKIQTEDQRFILVPIHAYPVVNKLDFPRNISFGSSPLCETATRVISLRCSVPVDFSFDIEVVKPHPYFRVEPLKGIIPANGEITIRVSFLPITLGSCSLSMKLHVGQYGWTPMVCDISAKAVSGLLESRELKEAQIRLMEYIKSTGEVINNQLGAKSTFRGDLTFRPDPAVTTRGLDQTAVETSSGKRGGPGATAMLLQSSGAKNHLKDPTASLLSSTFRASDLNSALDMVLQRPDLLSTKVNTESSSGVRGVDGVLKSTLPTKARGTGSGIVFDAGAMLITMKQQKIHAKSAGASPNGIVPPKYQDTTVEGYRIPPNLDTAPAVNFVYTQEPGKLKPKDLKVAIEKSRAERELRAEEQKKIREEGGGAGMLDLRGILAEERLNLAEGDPFKRQLREMAFLADADDVEKQEAEKQFRVSEEFLGSLQLSAADIEMVYRQRSQAYRHKQREAWRLAQSRQHTASFPPSDDHVKAGAPAEVAKRATATLKPSFDTNRNDIWAKRMNTSRRLISLVSKWLVRTRLDRRMGKVKKCFEGITTKEEAKEFIARENADAKALGPSAGSAANNAKATSSTTMSLEEAMSKQEFATVAEMVCTAPSDVAVRRQNNERIISSNRYEFTANMVRRVLFPKFVAEEASSRSEMKPVSLEVAPSFDDRTFFQLKARPEFVSMGYLPQKLPPTALTFSTTVKLALRDGAAEETFLRPAADTIIKVVDIQVNMPPEPPELAQLRATVADADAEFDETSIASPEWLTAEPTWSLADLNYFQTRPDFRTYMQAPSRTEKDGDWSLRPFAEHFVFDEDNSLRSEWMKTPGFQSVNRYLLAGHESRTAGQVPPVGPTISDFYVSDTDRHLSGMYCFSRDHLRSLVENDVDIAPLQVAQDKGDVLTDSESDDDDGYVAERPSIAKAKKIFRDATSLEQQADDAVDAGASLDMSMESDGFGLLSPTKRREEQVELMRDRKTLELEASLLRVRQQNDEALFRRLIEVSKSTKCLINALQLQVPFSLYEEDLVKSGRVEQLLPPLLKSFVQHSHLHEGSLSPTKSLLDLSLSIGSPTH